MHTKEAGSRWCGTDLTDQQWELVQDLFPPPARTGRPRRDRREYLDGIFWIFWIGAPGATCPWSSAPGPPPGTSSTPGTRTGRWVRSSPDCGPPASTRAWWMASCGASTAPWSAPPECRRGRQGRRSRGARRSRPGAFPRRLLDQDPSAVRRPWPPAGLPSDARGRCTRGAGLVPLLEGAEERVVDGDGEAIEWPVALAGDKGFRADWIDEYLLELGITPVIPSKENEDRAARAVECDREAYRRRSIVECLIGWLKECRRIFCDSRRRPRTSAA